MAGWGIKNEPPVKRPLAKKSPGHAYPPPVTAMKIIMRKGGHSIQAGAFNTSG